MKRTTLADLVYSAFNEEAFAEALALQIGSYIDYEELAEQVLDGSSDEIEELALEAARDELGE